MTTLQRTRASQTKSHTHTHTKREAQLKIRIRISWSGGREGVQKRQNSLGAPSRLSAFLLLTTAAVVTITAAAAVTAAALGAVGVFMCSLREMQFVFLGCCYFLSLFQLFHPILTLNSSAHPLKKAVLEELEIKIENQI